MMKNFIYIFSGLVLVSLSCGVNQQQKIIDAQQHIEEKDFKTAKSMLLEIYNSAPENVGAIQSLVALARLQGATEAHEHWCEELLKFRPWAREANIVVGKKLMREGNLADAVSRFTLALNESEFKQDKKDVQLLINQAYQQMNN